MQLEDCTQGMARPQHPFVLPANFVGSQKEDQNNSIRAPFPLQPDWSTLPPLPRHLACFVGFLSGAES
jgi:hypothetical protein